VDYHVRLEQGRTLNPSEAVLDAISRALRLDSTERAHLFDLARPAPARRRRTPRRPQRVSAVMHQLLETLELAASPAFIIGRRMDVLAINRLGGGLICDFYALPAGRRNKARFISSTRTLAASTRTGTSSPPRPPPSCAWTPAGTRTTLRLLAHWITETAPAISSASL
jgi:hypothetical protein